MKLVTREKRQRVIELKEQVDEYAGCLREALDDVLEIECLNRLTELAYKMKCIDLLESRGTQKKREEKAEEDGESLGDL